VAINITPGGVFFPGRPLPRLWEHVLAQQHEQARQRRIGSTNKQGGAPVPNRCLLVDPLVMTHIAIENGQFVVDLPMVIFHNFP